MKAPSLVEAMRRILNLAMEKISYASVVTEDVAFALVDLIVEIAIDMSQTGQSLLRHHACITSN